MGILWALCGYYRREDLCIEPRRACKVYGVYYAVGQKDPLHKMLGFDGRYKKSGFGSAVAPVL